MQPVPLANAAIKGGPKFAYFSTARNHAGCRGRFILFVLGPLPEPRLPNKGLTP